MRPYLANLGARFRLLLQYRAAAAAGFGTQLAFGFMRMMVFLAFYENAGPQPMSLRQTIAYIWLGQAFLGLLPFRPDAELDHLIRSGNVVYELLRPVDLYAFWFSRTIANRLAPTAMRAAPMLVIATLADWIVWPNWLGLVATLASLTGAVLLTTALTTLLSITSFWTLSGQGVSGLVFAMMFLFSGMIVPLPLFPDWSQPILTALPFRGLIDVPFRLFTGHMTAGDLVPAMAHQAVWTVGLIIGGRALLRRALRRVVVQGG